MTFQLRKGYNLHHVNIFSLGHPFSSEKDNSHVNHRMKNEQGTTNVTFNGENKWTLKVFLNCSNKILKTADVKM